MNDSDVKRIGQKLAEGIKTQGDCEKMLGKLLKSFYETVLNAELDEHLGCARHSKATARRANTRNGYGQKTLKTDRGPIEIDAPRDRDASFKPAIISKGETRIKGLDETILTLYARGMTVRDIQSTLRDIYRGAEVSAGTVARVTDAVNDDIRAWMNRPLDELYPIVYFDGLCVKVHADGRVVNKTVHLALAINKEGHKELLGLWIAERESSKLWLSIFTELQNRGVKDIIIACMDGITGGADALAAAFPKAKLQLCVAHMLRNSMRYVASKDRQAVANDLKAVYRATGVRAAEHALEKFAETWDRKYPSISRQWRRNWPDVITMFDYPSEIRRIIYTTNAIESLNSVIRKAIRNRKIFPSDQSALKLVYLAVMQASARWSKPLNNWNPAMNRFAIEYDKRWS